MRGALKSLFVKGKVSMYAVMGELDSRSGFPKTG